MNDWDAERHALLRQHARDYAEVALANIEREFPHVERHLQTEPGEIPRPRELHPAFYGSFDWHSCVEMHWVLIRLLRLVPELVPQDRVRAALNEHLAAGPLAAESAYFADHPGRGPNPPPYGWGWPLKLACEAGSWPDSDARRWAANLRDLTEVCATRYLDWLPRATYAVRHGMHTNSAFGLSLALQYAAQRASEGDHALLEAIGDAAHRWFDDDKGYAAEWEPSGIDFLSPALAEAELMAAMLEPVQFGRWLDRFLPHLNDRRPATLFTPVTVSDPSDGLIAHLHGLNLSRAWCWQRIAATLPGDDPRVPALLSTVRDHAQAALPHVAGDDYMVEHWLVCYAVLLLS
jgi:DUF2891 family protein